MNTTAEYVFTVRGLRIAFLNGKSETVAVEDLHFEIKPGETLAIVGESGSGKSVSALSVLKLLPGSHNVKVNGQLIFKPVAGHSVLTDSIRLGELDENAMRKLRGASIAMIFQEPMTSLNPVMTCGKQVSEAIRVHQKVSVSESKKLALQWFDEVMLPSPQRIYTSYPHQLSGGQRQRVMIAMALANRPALLIADEPTTALDVTVQKSVTTLLKNLQRKYGMAVIFITHDLGVVAEIADRVLVMKNGAVIESGTVNEVLNNPREAYTKMLLASMPVPGIRKKRLQVGEAAAVTTHSVNFSPLPEASASEVFLKVSNLSKTYFRKTGFGSFKKEEVHAVKNVSFEVYRGETLGLVGESGCGKTTLSRMLLGLIKPTGGCIICEGQNLATASRWEWKQWSTRFQIVFQDPYSSLNPRIKTGEAIMEPMRVHGLYSNADERKSKALQLLHLTGLSEAHFHRYPHELSGGQRQRIVIARALAVNPQFIICDEAVSALDVTVQAQVLNLLCDLKDELNLTYIFISHNLAVVYHMSDRIMVMNKGEIEECGKARDVLYNAQSDYTKKLIGAIPAIHR